MTGQTTELALPASTDQWVQAVTTHPVQFAIVAVVALVAAGLTGRLLTRVSRRAKGAAASSGVTAERVLTLATSAIASVVAAQGMFAFFTGIADMPTPLVFATFAFIELMVVASAMRARRSQLDTGSGGVDGIAMWVLTILSGVLAATHAASLGEWLLRLVAPLVAAWGWERSMALERRKLTGRSGGMNWRISPQRLLVRWGITDPTDRTTAEVAVERRLSDLASAADAVRLARSTRAGDRAERRAIRRLHRAIDKATDDGIVLGETSVRDRLAEHLEGRFSAYTLPDYQPATDWADHQLVRASRATLDAIDPDRAVRAEFDELTVALDREFAARAIAPSALVARDETDEPRAELTTPIAREPIVSRATETFDVARDTSPTARDEEIARAETPVDPIADERPTAAVFARAEDVSHAAHSPAELGTDREPTAAREDEQAPIARATGDAAARDLAPLMSLVRAPEPSRATRETVPTVARATSDSSRASRAPIARDTAVDGALARDIDRAPRAASVARDTTGVGPFARELTRAESVRLARAVRDRRKSKQPEDMLAKIYLAHSQGMTANSIGDTVGLAHSTVGRAIDAAIEVSRPRAVD